MLRSVAAPRRGKPTAIRRYRATRRQNECGASAAAGSFVSDGLDAGIAEVAGFGKSVNARDLAGPQFLLQPLPVLHRHQLGVRRTKCPAQFALADPQTDFNFLGQEYD